jgi:hypothetical protein
LNIFHFFILFVMPSAIVLEEIAFLRSYTFYKKYLLIILQNNLKFLYNSPFLLEIKYLSKPGLMYFKMYHLTQLLLVLSYRFMNINNKVFAFDINIINFIIIIIISN